MNKQVFIITCGVEPSGKAGLAFSQAAIAQAMGQDVYIFLVLEGAKWAFDQYGHDYMHECFDRPIEALKRCMDLGGSVTICTLCNDQYQNKTNGTLKENISISTLGQLQEEISHCKNILIY